MVDLAHRTVELREYEGVRIPAAALTEELGESLWRRWGGKIDVEFPTPKTGGRWQLKSLGWVGYIPVSEDLTLYLSPKIPLENLFRLLEYAYSLKIHFPGGLTRCGSLAEFYERLAGVLARRVMDRGRRGFYREYVQREDTLPYVRGRLDVEGALRRPWDVSLRCHFDEQTADVEENQILLWTLSRIAQSGLCSERVMATVRRAYRLLQGAASLRPFEPEACVGRLYSRLNDDYEGLHGLCRFFLEHSGPTHRTGRHAMLPFLIDMARLFELFVARWLEVHLPAEYSSRAQVRVALGDYDEIKLRIDLVVSERSTGRTLCVLDTKYKEHDSPSTADINQVVTYAVVKNAPLAVLIYPRRLARPTSATFGDFGIRVRTLAFPLHGDIEEAGRAFLNELLSALGSATGRVALR